MAEALLDDRDPQTIHAAFQKLGILRHLVGLLSHIKTVGTGDDFEHERIVSNIPRHRPSVVDRHLHALPTRSSNETCRCRSWSGRIEARTGLRMMPTFPRSSLSFAE